MEDYVETIDMTEYLEDDTKNDEKEDNEQMAQNILEENLKNNKENKVENIEDILAQNTEEEQMKNLRRFSKKLKSELKPYTESEEYNDLYDVEDIAMQELMKAQNIDKNVVKNDTKPDNTSIHDSSEIKSQTSNDISNTNSPNSSPTKSKEIDFNIDNIIPEQSDFVIPNEIKDPIEFVDYIENKLYSDYINKNEEKFFQIQKYKNSLPDKFEDLPSLCFLNKQVLNDRIFQKQDKIITCIGVKDNFIFVGDNKCVIKMYSLDKEFEYKSFYIDKIPDVFEQEINDKIIKENNSTTCIDISPMCNYMISGYKNGFIALWDINSGKCEKIFKDEYVADKSGILCILTLKFLSQKKEKYFSFISSDGRGYVNKITISETFFGWGGGLNVNVDSLIQYKNPIFVVEVMELSENEKHMDFYENSQSEVAAFGSVDFVLIYQVSPSIIKYFSFSRPQYFTTHLVPDISFGVGFIPRNLPMIDEENEEPLNLLARKEDINPREIQRLISVSWNTFINVYCLKTDPYYGPQKVVCVGNFSNENVILRSRFVAESTLLIFEKCKGKNKIKLLNTGLMSPNELMLNPETELPFYYKENEIRAYVQKPYIFGKEEFLSQLIAPIHRFKDGKISKCAYRFIETYFNSFLFGQKRFFILSTDKIIHGKFKSYSEFLEELKEQSFWIELFAYGENIYNNKYNALIDLPVLKSKRNKEISQKLTDIVVYFINLNFKNNWSQGPKFMENLKSCILLAVEFLIRIKNISFLINEIKPIFDKKGLENFFLESLQSFILSGILSDYEFPIDLIEKIINYYVNCRKYHILGQIIVNLRASVINLDLCRRVCKNNNIFTGVMYLNAYGEERNFFLPFLNMFQCLISNQTKKIPHLLINSQEIKNKLTKEIFFDYTKLIRCVNLDYLDSSYLFLGNRILWYFWKILNKRIYDKGEGIYMKNKNDNTMNKRNNIFDFINFDWKYKSNKNENKTKKNNKNDKIYQICISDTEYADLIRKILLCLMNKNNMKTLIRVNAYSYFELLKRIFIENWNILNGIKYDKLLFEGIDISLNEKENEGKAVDVRLFLQLITNMIKNSQDYPGKMYIDDDISDFICSIAKERKVFEKSLVIDAIKHILMYEKNIKVENEYKDKIKRHYDFFNMHYNRYHSPSFYTHYSFLIGGCIETYLDDLNNDDWSELKAASDETSLDELRIFLFTKSRDYMRCIDIYIGKDNNDKDNEYIDDNKEYERDIENKKGGIDKGNKNNDGDNNKSLEDKRMKDNLRNQYNNSNENMENNYDKMIKHKQEQVFDYIDYVFKKFIFIIKRDGLGKTSEVNKEFEQLKAGVLDRTEELVKISVDKLISLISLYYLSNFSLFLPHISSKLLKLRFLERLHTDREDTEDSLAAEHLRILCELGRFNEALPAVIGRKIPVNEILELCDKYKPKLVDLAIYINKKRGDLESAFADVEEEIKKHHRHMIMYTNDTDKFNESYKLFCDFFNEGISICEMGKEIYQEKELEKIWFDFLKLIYDMRLKDPKLVNKDISQEGIEEIKRILKESITSLLERLPSFLPLTVIVERVSSFPLETSSSLSKVVLEILGGYEDLRVVLDKVRSLLSFMVKEKNDEREEEIRRGVTLIKGDNWKCDVCGKEDEGGIEIFKCGHKLHYLCSILINEEVRCPICFDIEIANTDTKYKEYEIEKPNMDIRKERSRTNAIIRFDKRGKNYEDNISKKYNTKKFKNIRKKLNKIDDQFFSDSMYIE